MLFHALLLDRRSPQSLPFSLQLSASEPLASLLLRPAARPSLWTSPMAHWSRAFPVLGSWLRVLKCIIGTSSERDVSAYRKRPLICIHNLALVSRFQTFPQDFKGTALEKSLEFYLQMLWRCLFIPNTLKFHKNKSRWGFLFHSPWSVLEGPFHFLQFFVCFFVFKNFFSVCSVFSIL